MFRKCFAHLHRIERKRIPPTPAGHLRLHRLERPVPWSDDLLDAIAAAQTPINQYPDYAPFYDRLAAFAGVPSESIVVGAGIEDFIRTLVMLCCDPGDGFAFTWPTCAMFDIYAHAFNASAIKIATDPARPLGAHVVAQAARSSKLLVLPNPGQPFETFFGLDELRMIARAAHASGCVVAIDEAYHGFGAPTAVALAFEFENVVVLRTFSKCFGAAGIRVGYAIAGERIARTLHAVRPSGEIAGPSMAAASVLIERWADVRDGIAAICEGRDWVATQVRGLGFDVRGSLANHVLIDMGTRERADLVAEHLLGRRVHVRTNSAPLDAHLLVTCGPIEIMQTFMDAFRRSL